MNDAKIIIINGHPDSKRGITDGGIQLIGSVKEDCLHSQCLLDYAHDKYSDLPFFNSLTYTHKPETIGFFFTHYFNDIVFLNTTKNPDRHGYTGILMLPNKIGEAQHDMLMNIATQFDDYQIDLSYDLYVKDGFIEGKERMCTTLEPLSKNLENFFESRRADNSKKQAK